MPVIRFPKEGLPHSGFTEDRGPPKTVKIDFQRFHTFSQSKSPPSVVFPDPTP
jgi:hypothetical protein